MISILVLVITYFMIGVHLMTDSSRSTTDITNPVSKNPGAKEVHNHKNYNGYSVEDPPKAENEVSYHHRHDSQEPNGVTTPTTMVIKPAYVNSSYENTTRSNANQTLCFMDQECVQNQAKHYVRVWPYRFDRNWIIEPDTHPTEVYGQDNANNYTVAGILYVKNFKAASTTTAGAAFRMAYHVPSSASSTKSTTLSQPRSKPAWIKAHHTRGNHYRDRHPTKSFLFTSIREPASRAMSRIFYTSITEKQEKPTDTNVLSKLKWNQIQYGAVSHNGGGYQVRYLSKNKTLATSWNMDEPNKIQDVDKIHAAIQEILQFYDFILVAERLDESIVVMSLLLNIELQDVLVQSAKVGSAASYLYFTTHNKKKGFREYCRPYVKTFAPPLVKQHLQSQEWYAKNYGDYLLHAVANLSLDATIATLGRTEVELALQEYHRLKSKAEMLCSNTTIYHCSSNGTIQTHLSALNCYEDDSGCGYPCIDKMLEKENERKQ